MTGVRLPAPRLALLTLLALGWLMVPALASPQSATPAAEGEQAATGNAQRFRVTLLGEEPSELDSADLIGHKPIVLILWATWCGPCIKEGPVLQTLFEEYGNQVQFVAVSIDEGDPKVMPARLLDFAAKKGWTYPLAWDAEGALVDQYGVTGIPFSVMIDLAGNEHPKLGYTALPEFRKRFQTLFGME